MTVLDGHISSIKDICEKHFVSEFALFGSRANGNSKDQSDIDLLVSFNNKLAILNYADNFFSLKQTLQSLLKKEVDLVTKKSIKNPILKKEIDQTKIILYEE